MAEGKSWGGPRAGFISPNGEMLVCLIRWAHLGSDFGGLIVLLLPGDVQSSINYFFHRNFWSSH